jgi:hypothetical protein
MMESKNVKMPETHYAESLIKHTKSENRFCFEEDVQQIVDTANKAIKERDRMSALCSAQERKISVLAEELDRLRGSLKDVKYLSDRGDGGYITRKRRYGLLKNIHHIATNALSTIKGGE